MKNQCFIIEKWIFSHVDCFNGWLEIESNIKIDWASDFPASEEWSKNYLDQSIRFIFYHISVAPVSS